jgi:hypothetical protein
MKEILWLVGGLSATAIGAGLFLLSLIWFAQPSSPPSTITCPICQKTVTLNEVWNTGFSVRAIYKTPDGKHITTLKRDWKFWPINSVERLD